MRNKSNRSKSMKSRKSFLDEMERDCLGNIDSLSCFRRKKTSSIDDQFWKLKTELHSLFVHTKDKTSEILSRNETIRLKPKDSSHASKFSEWMNETIDKIDLVFPSCSKKPPKPTSDLAALSDFKVEELVYKAFYLQHMGNFVLTSSDESEPQEVQPKEEEKERKRKCRKKRTKSSHSGKNFKKQKAPGDNDVEVINIDNSFAEAEHKKVNYVDLAVDDYDWDEPFFGRNADFSDLEIIESTANKKNNEKRKSRAASTSAQGRSSNGCSTSTANRTWECPICFEPSQGQSIVATLCGHIFCKSCLDKNNSTHGKFCPTCRFDLRDKAPITLFNM